MKNILKNTDSETPRILVISNNCLSENNSNGRTLASFLRNISKENIAQIYVSNEMPASLVCNNFYRITDRDVIKGVYKKGEVGKIVGNVKNQTACVNGNQQNKVKKTIFTMILRDLLWSINKWHTEELDKWIKSFSPTVILFFAGESCFTYNIALRLADKYNLPIVLYNSESYYLKDKNYIKNSNISNILYPMFHRRFKRVFEKTVKRAEHIIHLNHELKTAYDKVLSKESTAIYTSSEVEYIKDDKTHNPPVVSYLGNLGIGRDIALNEIAEALQDINPQYKLNIYGKIPNDNVRNTFDRNPGINYCGLVSYEKVKAVMHESDLLIHAESFDEFTVWDLKYAFTTKIADSLSCGTCFFIYAPADLACTKYLKENNCACVVTQKEDLKSTLERILLDKELREKYITNAKKIAEQNHDTAKNCIKFEKILAEAVRQYENNAN